MQNWILRHICNRRFRFFEAFCNFGLKSANLRIFLLHKFSIGVKNAEFDADFESVKKWLYKSLGKKVGKIELMTFITVFKRCWPITFLGWPFCTFFNVLVVSKEFCGFFTPYGIFAKQICFGLYGYFLKTFEPKSHETAIIKKKRKFSSYLRKLRVEQLQSHIWERAS